MCLKLSAAVWDKYSCPGTPTAKLVLLALADYADKSTGVAYPSMTKLGQRCGLSAVQARRLCRKLEDELVIFCVGNSLGGDPGQTRRYKIDINRLSTPLRIEQNTPIADDRG